MMIKKFVHCFGSCYDTVIQSHFKSFTAVCTCGKKFGGTSPEEADLKLKEHIRKENL